MRHASHTNNSREQTRLSELLKVNHHTIYLQNLGEYSEDTKFEKGNTSYVPYMNFIGFIAGPGAREWLAGDNVKKVENLKTLKSSNKNSKQHNLTREVHRSMVCHLRHWYALGIEKEREERR